MTFASTAGTMAALHALSAQQQAMWDEEEDRATYSDEELMGDYEFKILRCAVRAFGDPQRLRAVLAEEKQCGWILLEKFDDQRIRLKRPAEASRDDKRMLARGIDPHRTSLPVGMNRAALIAIIVAVVAMLALIITAILGS